MASDDDHEIEIREVRKKKNTVRFRSSNSTEFERDLQFDAETRHIAGPTESRPFDMAAHNEEVAAKATAEVRAQFERDRKALAGAAVKMPGEDGCDDGLIDYYGSNQHREPSDR